MRAAFRKPSAAFVWRAVDAVRFFLCVCFEICGGPHVAGWRWWVGGYHLLAVSPATKYVWIVAIYVSFLRCV